MLGKSFHNVDFLIMPVSPLSKNLEESVQTLLQQLSSKEKLQLLDGDTSFWAGMADIALADASHHHPWPAGQLPRFGLGGLQFVDGPRGVVLVGGATTFPVPIARGASWNPELEERIGVAIAREARSFGANWLAAVCINLLRHPGWGRAQETYGEDPVHVGELGASCTRGIERHAISCIKHFALNSIDSSRFLVDVQVSTRVLHELYLPHFRDCVIAGAGSVMTAYNRVNGLWCSQNPELLNGILKRRWGFTGLVVTDFIFGLRDGVAGLLAGLDLEMPFRMILQGSFADSFTSGPISREAIQARIDDAVRRQLRQQLRIPIGSYPTALRGCAEHLALARDAARQGIVLLRNKPVANHCSAVLPLQHLSSLAVIGPLADAVNLGDRGSSDTRPPRGVVVTPLAGLRAARPELAIHHVDGRSRDDAASLAACCDTAVLVLGLDWRLEGEHIHPSDIAPILRQVPPPDWLMASMVWPLAQPLWHRFTALLAWITGHGSLRKGGNFAAGDRTELCLPESQVMLIRAVAAVNPRTVVVLMGGGAILTSDWDDLVPGLLMLWYPGEQGGHALADVLLGVVSPSGRLPFAIPRDMAHLPRFEPRATRVRYDLWHGYRRLQRHHHVAAYSFGFGLSYSHFLHSQLEVRLLQPDASSWDAVELHLLVTNAGLMMAAEVVQVYLEPPGQLMERPRRCLVGFQRLELRPAERRQIHLRIPLRRLACFSERRDGFVLESGLHRLVAAQHADDPGLSVDLDLPLELVEHYWES